MQGTMRFRIRREHIISMSALAVVLLSILCFPIPESDAAPQNHPQDEYSYADAIIYEDRGTKVSYKTYVEGKDGALEVRWDTKDLNGRDFTVFDWASMDRSMTVVMCGGSLYSLTLIGVGEEPAYGSVFDMDFEMYGGSLQVLNVVDVYDSVKLTDSYSNTVNIAGDVTLDLRAGSIRELSPSSDMIKIDSMSIIVGKDMAVDRLLPSGTNGKYNSVSVTLSGGRIGYMSNIKSVIGSLEYNILSGSVDYFCIGANTEGDNIKALGDMNTSYVQGDVTVKVNDSVKMRMMVLGAGIVEPPSILCNGERPAQIAAKNVIIEAKGVTLRMDTCFLTEKANSAYHFSNYRVGSTVYTAPLGTTCSLGDGTQIDIYGDDGIWQGYSEIDVKSGITMFINADATVNASGRLHIYEGGRIVLSGNILLKGEMINDGTLENNGIIEMLGDGIFEGSSRGDGFIADSINSPPTDVISVISDNGTVIIHVGDQSPSIKQIMAVVGGGGLIDITVPNGIELKWNWFLLSLEMSTPAKGFDASFRLAVEGMDPKVLGICDITVTVPLIPLDGYVGEIYRFDDSGGEYVKIDGVSVDRPGITFTTNQCGEYHVRFVESNTEPPGGSNGFPFSAFEMALMAAIVFVGVITVYVLVRKR